MMEWILLIFVLPYFFLLLRIYYNLREVRQFDPVESGPVLISVIIPCRNENDNISRILTEVSIQDYPEDLFEVIVVDDNSTDTSFKTALEFTGIKNCKVLRNTGSGKKMALHTGITSAIGDLVITTDADCLMKKEWLSVIASFYSANKPDLIICPVVLETIPGFFGKVQELEFLSLQGITAGTALGNNGTMCNGANLAFRRAAWITHSRDLRNDIPSGDDIFLLHSLKKKPDARIMWLESCKAVVTASASKTIPDFIRQRSRWISKGRAYTDKYTITLAIVTFVTILSQMIFLLSGLFNPVFFLIYLASIGIKSVPDYLILSNTTERYSKKNLMRWFIPSQLVYPFYVLAVALRF
ncbi:MAG: glycosyltransferase [Bacteroidota bacterium]|nr:glycosyltransferase [Bacteroidota bacterium]